ncbi:MAG: hypothetical protein HXX08_03270 [Chloroflexi bacterium]|uniref:Uncharacterized protein n=2 Tax=Candidatus Chlorohelix allophototropha TaxID=3003348 RepID=A0A8T7M1Y7_9CHLR|nr:hypothetical protein [Chloroflexota bacterium]WJW66758.1 hypothetical protein OZ401_000002 [Chloroflexota bacterium L227-S17]
MKTMTLMRYTIIDSETTVSFLAPGNVLKALAAACSAKPAPTSLLALLENANKYDSGLQQYVLSSLEIFDQHLVQPEIKMDSRLEADLRDVLDNLNFPDQPVSISGSAFAGYADLLNLQQNSNPQRLTAHPVLRVLDDVTRNESLQPISAGLVIFNLRARRIIQVQNSFGLLQRSDRGRYFENGIPSERLFFYRLPIDWSLVP